MWGQMSVRSPFPQLHAERTRVICIEADPQIVSLLRRNVTETADPTLQLSTASQGRSMIQKWHSIAHPQQNSEWDPSALNSVHRL